MYQKYQFVAKIMNLNEDLSLATWDGLAEELNIQQSQPWESEKSPGKILQNIFKNVHKNFYKLNWQQYEDLSDNEKFDCQNAKHRLDNFIEMMNKNSMFLTKRPTVKQQLLSFAFILNNKQ